MLRAKLFSLTTLLTMCGIFSLASPALAQRGGGGHGGGGHGGGHSSGGHSSGGHSGGAWSGGHGSAGHSSGSHWSGGHDSSNHWSGSHGYNGYGHNGYGRGYWYDYGPAWGFGYGSTFWGPRSYFYDDYYDYVPSYGGDRYVVPSYYPAYQESLPAAIDNRAHIDVVLPDPNAQVLMQGQKTTSRGEMRHFVSPDLSPGSRYTYTIAASWNRDGRMVTEQREVEVSPGRSTVVDFTQPAARQ